MKKIIAAALATLFAAGVFAAQAKPAASAASKAAPAKAEAKAPAASAKK